MEAELKNQYALKLWDKTLLKFIAYGTQTFDVETRRELILPLPEPNAKISTPLYAYFSKTVKSSAHWSKAHSILIQHSFNRILEKAISGKTKDQTLNMFAIFCGYESFEDFTEKEPITYEEVYDILKKKVTYKTSTYILVTVLFVVIGFFAWYLNKHQKDSQRLMSFNEEKELYDYVDEAINAELNTFRKLPIIDTTKLAKYYSPSCEEYWPTIIRVLNVHENQNLILTNIENASFAKIDTIYIKELRGDTAIINTVEQWDLLWYNFKKAEYDSTKIRKNDFLATYHILRNQTRSPRIVHYTSKLLQRRYQWQKK